MKYAARLFDDQRITSIMYACIIMHNMMVEAKGRAICTYDETETEKNEQLYIPGSTEFLARVVAIQNANTCHNLREDLATYVTIFEKTWQPMSTNTTMPDSILSYFYLIVFLFYCIFYLNEEF